MLKNVSKQKKIMKTEKTIRELIGDMKVGCSNPECRAKVILRKEELDKVFSCSTCNKGILNRRIEIKNKKKRH